MSLQQQVRRLAVGGGILALALAGILGTQSAATAEGFELPPDQSGSLTIHKYETNEQPLGGQILEGVGFSVQQVGQMDGMVCEAIDLTTLEGWQAATAAIDAFTAGDTSLPTGFCNVGSAIDVVTGVDGTVPVPNLKGLYFVKETSPGPHMITGPEDPFLVAVPMPVPGSPGTWNFAVNAYPKNVLGDFTPEKTVEGSNVDGSVVPGALVPWNISTPIPVAAFPYTTITVTDTPAAGHTFEAWGAIELNGTPLEGPTAAIPDYTVSGSSFTLTEAGLVKVNAIVTGDEAVAATLTVDLTTKVTGVVLGGLTNKAEVTLNGETRPTLTPQSNWGKLIINKHVVNDENASLAGARFAVYERTVADCAVDVTGTPVWQTPATPDPSAAQQSAVLWISNTLPGASVGSKDYCLQETQPPTGHLLDTTPRVVTIAVANDWTTTLAFPNTPVRGPQLPLTGSTGSMAFALVGFGLIGTAGALYAVRRGLATKK